MAKMWAKQERLLERALGVSESRLDNYCKPVSDDFLERLARQRPQNIEQLKLTWYGYPKGSIERYCATRYTAINLASYFYRGTVEVRSFAFRSGKLHAGEVKAYVQLVAGTTPDAVPPEEIVALCASKLAAFKVPRYVEYRLIDFPRTPSMRIQKEMLKRERENLVAGVWDREQAMGPKLR